MRNKHKNKHPSETLRLRFGVGSKHHSHCQSLMSYSAYSLHIVVTLKEPAGDHAERFISVRAVRAGGLEFTLSSLWMLRHHYGGISHRHGCLYLKITRTPHYTTTHRSSAVCFSTGSQWYSFKSSQRRATILDYYIVNKL